MTEKEITIKDILDKSTYMDNLIEMLSFYKEMAVKCYDNDNKFKSMISSAFLVFMNEEIGKHN
jgi:hypothetical protein